MRFAVAILCIALAGCARPAVTVSPPPPDQPEAPNREIKPLTMEQDEQLAE